MYKELLITINYSQAFSITQFSKESLVLMNVSRVHLKIYQISPLTFIKRKLS